VKLTEKQQKFVDYYLASGNAEDAAKKAGYNARGNTTKLLQNTTIQKAIEERNKTIVSDRIANMEEVKQFWTNTLRDSEADLKHRLKASEYIAKTNAAFIERQEISGEMTQTINQDLSKLSLGELKQIESILSKAE
jgi:phage terminase small subunit